MAENKKLTAKIWMTTDQKDPKTTPNKTGVVREKSSYTGRISESSVGKFRNGGTIIESQGPSRHKSQESNKCYSQGPCKPRK